MTYDQCFANILPPQLPHQEAVAQGKVLTPEDKWLPDIRTHGKVAGANIALFSP